MSTVTPLVAEDAARAQAHQADRLSQRTHRIAIGVLGLLLPLLVWLFAGRRPTVGLDRPWERLDSISAYFYTGGAGVFTGVLIALSLFLTTYPGYKGFIWDRVVGVTGGIAAAVVALVPTRPPKPLPIPAWWTNTLGVIHYVSAVVLFTSFILFSLWLFRKSSVPKGAKRPFEKVLRDQVCLVCGLVMVGAVLWAGRAGFTDGPIFVPEAIAVEAFAISWLTKATSR